MASPLSRATSRAVAARPPGVTRPAGSLTRSRARQGASAMRAPSRAAAERPARAFASPPRLVVRSSRARICTRASLSGFFSRLYLSKEYAPSEAPSASACTSRSSSSLPSAFSDRAGSACGQTSASARAPAGRAAFTARDAAVRRASRARSGSPCFPTPSTRRRCAATLPCVCNDSCWPSLPVNSSCAATAPRRPPRARSRSLKCASEILPPATAPSRTRTASRSQAWETGFAKTTCVSRAIAFLVGETGPYRTKIGAPPGPRRRLHSARCADTVRSPLQADGRAVDDKLQEIEHKFERLEADLGDPGVLSDQARYRQTTKERSQLQPLVEAFRELKRVRAEVADYDAALNDADPEMRQMAKDELPALRGKAAELEEKLKILLLPKDPNDERDVILEVRARAGGDEAGLFASEVLRMYLRYAERMGWRATLMDTSANAAGGIKDASFTLEGEGVYSSLKYESGVHRVQRVPATEAQGRIHTSTVTVAVMPEAEDVDVQINPPAIQMDVMRSTGAGGQSVNTTDSAVRLTHKPSGGGGKGQQEKSQLKNRAKAPKRGRNKR